MKYKNEKGKVYKRFSGENEMRSYKKGEER